MLLYACILANGLHATKLLLFLFQSSYFVLSNTCSTVGGSGSGFCIQLLQLLRRGRKVWMISTRLRNRTRLRFGCGLGVSESLSYSVNSVTSEICSRPVVPDWLRQPQHSDSSQRQQIIIFTHPQV